jgi:RimJ/RimL family protein N-acetyltransferase
MEKRLLQQDETYGIWRYDHIPDEVVQFLDSVSWGNEGAVYEHEKTEEHIRQLHQPTLLTVQQGDEVLATAIFCHTPVWVGTEQINSFYIRYFAASPKIKGKGIVKYYGQKVMELIRQGEHEKTVFFASVEKGNKPSFKAVQNSGYQPIGIMKTMGMSRFFPRVSPNVFHAKSSEEQKLIIQLLKNQYRDYALVHFNYLFLNGNYFYIKDKGEIVASCQYHRAHWVVHHMKGWSGKFIMNVVPHVPLLNGVFNPRKFEFLGFEGIYCKPGFEHRLFELLESLLAQEGIKAAMFWLSENCPLRQRIEKHGNLGLLHSFVHDSDVHIMASFHGFGEPEQNELRKMPLYACSYDYI